jgi:hypothetical protein
MISLERYHLEYGTVNAMEFSDLVTFSTVARCGGITRAAGE